MRIPFIGGTGSISVTPFAGSIQSFTESNEGNEEEHRMERSLGAA